MKTKTTVRATAVAGVAFLAVATAASTGHAGQGNENKSARGAQTQHQATDTFIDTVPCASDTGFFEITLTYNSTERFTDDRGHFRQTGTFSATPVEATEFEEETHDDHTHLSPVASEPREGQTYSGRFTVGGTMNNNRNATTETFTFRVNGMSSAGEKVQAHAVFHQTTVNGEVRSLIEKETCR
jgi:hypothetical protein